MASVLVSKLFSSLDELFSRIVLISSLTIQSKLVSLFKYKLVFLLEHNLIYQKRGLLTLGESNVSALAN